MSAKLEYEHDSLRRFMKKIDKEKLVDEILEYEQMNSLVQNDTAGNEEGAWTEGI